MIRTYNVTFATALLALNFYMLSRLSFVLDENKFIAFGIGIIILLLLAYLIWDKFSFSKKVISNKELVLQQRATVLTKQSKINFLIKIVLVIFTCVLGILTYYHNV
jgi:uncharacterized membrane protein